ncbi:MAG: group II intron reverse transcriptase/maturase [Oscillospiraceae bacterium]|nr:group II intron reverse transcriptase/maturase [Oscillospiraceae bacterium]
MHLSGNFSSEAQLKEKLDFIYQQSELGRVFHGILEVATNKATIVTAVHKIKSNKGSMTVGIDGYNVNKYLQMDMDELISLVKRNMYNYYARPVRRVYIEKSNGKKRPLGIPTFLDRIIQQCLKIVLEPIVEARFYPQSYGFRPYRSAKNAVQEMFQLANSELKQKAYYCIEGDIKKYFENINHRLMLKKLWNIGIHDKRVIAIIRSMMKAGYFEYEQCYATEKGTPQGGILSPLLANVYLNDFDWFIGRMYHYPFQQTALLTTDRNRLRYQGIIPKYLIRYADDWVIMTTSEQEAERLLKLLSKYFKHKLKLELSEEKTVTTNLENGYVDFLGYRLLVERKRENNGTLTDKNMCKIYPNPQRLQKQIRELRDEIDKLYHMGEPLRQAVQIEKINAKIIGISEYWKTSVCSRAFHKIDYAVSEKAFMVFQKNYCGNAKDYKVPLNELTNRPNRHKGYQDKVFAIKLDDMWIGLTKAYITHSGYSKGYFNQRISPYTQVGRELYKQKQKKMRPLSRPTLYDGETTLYKSMGNKIYNFEYFMNREYAYNRDKSKCKCCGEKLVRENRHCHHIKPKLSLDKINKVPNLAWLCKDCHRKIHGKQSIYGLSSKTVKKIIKYQNLLNEIS